MALTILPLELPAGQSLSNALQITHGLKIVRIAMPDDWTAAALTFQVSSDNATWWDLHHAQQSATGEWVSYAAVIPRIAPGSILSMPPGMGASIGWLRLRYRADT